MAQGKGGKQDPAKHTKKREQTHALKPCVLKAGQMKLLIKNLSNLRCSKEASRAAVFAVEYLMHEIIEGANSVAAGSNKKKIQPKHLNAAIRMDCELYRIGHKWLIKSGGTTAHLREEKSKKGKEGCPI
ncbi:hypothetical protein EDEG_00637 [Edhazardia aedis USNM 41457]|uniref:Core Histone H2A/H2B/H3 domain-containing protein n=1 Tax=Edhazardia aedis (strain USNM 41457) TaxID=1003232 RepID=J9DC35_EDHAE|nr:hypothetical protein EDEG_00637 [Edhazardia aedis USNM 41457]|eukprot:EJW05301.1 hypothetical protein EDEG_00637 [Edhazardia aedis USNM 41457]